MKKLDKIDTQILKILERNGRETIVQISNQVHLSQTPCIDRIRRLERDGYIQKYTIQLDPNLLDRGCIVFMQVSLADSTNQSFDQFAEAIAHIDDIEECYMVAGEFDCLVKIRVKDMDEFRQVITEKISEIPGITKTNSYTVIECVKSGSSLVRPFKADHD